MTSSQPEHATSKPGGPTPLHEGVYSLATPRNSGIGGLLMLCGNMIAVAFGLAAAAATFLVVGFGPWLLLTVSPNVDPDVLPADAIRIGATALFLVAAGAAGVCGYKATVIAMERFSYSRSTVATAQTSAYDRARPEGTVE